MTELHIYKAQSVGDHEAPDTVITLDEPLPDIKTIPGEKESDWRPFAIERFGREACELERALHTALPGGTYDALFGQMAKRKASVFVVSHGCA